MWDFLWYLFITIVAIISVTIGYFILRYVINIINKIQFEKEYGIHISKNFKVRRNTTEKDGVYVLEYPEWLYANKDRSRNKVRKGNELIYYPCDLYYKDYKITTKYPDKMVFLVHEIREKLGDNSIQKNDEEIKKYNDLKKKNDLYFKNNEIQTLIDGFRDEPNKFEEFCAEIYKKMDYLVTVTPKVNDGGYDLILHKDTEKCIVECKCYALRHSIGRPLIQKLVGANQKAQADRMIFVTTSSFTREAEEYAKDTNVELVDGEKLMRYVKEYLNKKSKNNSKVTREDWELNLSDIQKYYPPDVII